MDSLPSLQVEGFMGAFMAAFAVTQPEFNRPFGTHSLPGLEPNVQQKICLDEAESALLLQLCRANGVTVTALLNVLYLIAFVRDRAQLTGMKTVPIPAFSLHRGSDLLEGHSESVGVQLSLMPFALDARLVGECLLPERRPEAIWAASKTAKGLMSQAMVSTRVDPFARFPCKC